MPMGSFAFFMKWLGEEEDEQDDLHNGSWWFVL